MPVALHPPAVLAAVEDVDVVGEDDIALSVVLQALAVFLASVLLAVLLRRLLVRAVDRDGNRHIGLVAGRFLGLLAVALGVVYALGLLGVQIGPLLGALGVGGIAIAFAAQDRLQNLIAGVMLQIRRPLRLGDQVASGDFEGVVPTSTSGRRCSRSTTA